MSYSFYILSYTFYILSYSFYILSYSLYYFCVKSPGIPPQLSLSQTLESHCLPDHCQARITDDGILYCLIHFWSSFLRDSVDSLVPLSLMSQKCAVTRFLSLSSPPLLFCDIASQFLFSRPIAVIFDDSTSPSYPINSIIPFFSLSPVFSVSFFYGLWSNILIYSSADD